MAGRKPGCKNSMPAKANRQGAIAMSLPPEVQMALRIRAIKSDKTVGQVVELAVRAMYLDDVLEAEKELGKSPEEDT